MYDISTDTFLTDRAQIVDEVVKATAAVLTYSECCNAADSERGIRPSPFATAIMRKVLGEPRSMTRSVFDRHVRIMWREMVDA
jgi:hypothetical protein